MQRHLNICIYMFVEIVYVFLSAFLLTTPLLFTLCIPYVIGPHLLTAPQFL